MSASLLSLSRLQWSWTPQQAQNKMEDQEYFMAVAFLAAKQSPDTNSKVGACIVNTEKKIVGIGYNRMPIGCPAGSLPWARDNVDPLNNKYMYVCHAELNAIMNKNSADVKGCTIYVSLFPCNECTKIIIQSAQHTMASGDRLVPKQHTRQNGHLPPGPPPAPPPGPPPGPKPSVLLRHQIITLGEMLWLSEVQSKSYNALV
ncbi:deoxycytidylate deaminase-like isoform X13 [Alosa alosa]|uniref:deoxycytidylate deaminase-like isoform X13 n=1 Tax=Alosa alosa TaxID=278164 RepID=UPI0020151D29|nr:deoxycytidylate deaminase-like isoform X13 [Alosa alosa]XP_048088960.1 deoxycytidylate deaminase-like isoform X13 [Alosa alosa]